MTQNNSILAQAQLPAYSYDVEFSEGANRFLIHDNDFLYKDLLNAIADTTTNQDLKTLAHLVQFRQMTANELLTLKTRSLESACS